jgi:lipopolysaccharide exporter
VTAASQDGQQLSGAVRRGLAWSLLNSAVLRLGTFLTGIALARLLAPAEFGAFAVALTAQTVLINLSELGLTAVLVRDGEIGRRGPTVTTIAGGSGALAFLLMWTTAPALSDFMGAPEATSAVRLMSVVVLAAGLGVAPAARMQRDFQQQRQFAVDATNFVVSTVLTLALAMAGTGVMALAIGRVVGQVAATIIQFALVREWPRFGWDPAVGRSALALGLPLAGANVLSWVLLTVDNAIVGHVSGAAVLGLYALAFNVSSWPMSVIGMATRAVALPGFVRAEADREADAPDALRPAVAWTAAVALPVGVLLAVLAAPLVEVLYGPRWLPAAAALAGLGVFGAVRVVLDVVVSYLVAHGATYAVLLVQVVWLASLTPAMAVAVARYGLPGAGWVHPLVAVLVTVPAYGLVLARRGAAPLRVLAGTVVPVAGAGLVGFAAWAALQLADRPWPALLLGGTAGVLAWGLVLGPWVLRQRRDARTAPSVPGSQALQPTGPLVRSTAGTDAAPPGLGIVG